MNAALLTASHLLFQLVCINASRTTDCASRMDACVSKRICRSEQAVLRDVCNYKDGGCHAPDSKVCNATLQEMLSRSPALGECVCSGPDPCGTLQQLYSQCQHRLEHHASRSCLDETKACLGEEACNRRMVPFVQECNAYQCKPSQCRQAVRQFYSALPHNVAERLVFCDCDGEDQECQEMKTSLHAGSCGSDHSQTPWTCLEALDSCSGDALCRQMFNRYLSRCFGVEESAYDSTSDWLNLLNPDIFLGEDLQCRMAFVETMGSILHHPCTCDGLHHHDQYKCNELKEIFQDKSIFKRKKKSKTKVKVQHGESQESNIRRQPTNEPNADQQWLSDQLLYLLIYISALTVVVVFIVSLVLFRLRRMHRAAGKPTFEAHQSKSLMLSSVII